jgi:hypothetical protein
LVSENVVYDRGGRQLSGLPKRLPKLSTSGSAQDDSGNLEQLKRPASKGDDPEPSLCKAVYTGSIPVVASE